MQAAIHRCGMRAYDGYAYPASGSGFTPPRALTPVCGACGDSPLGVFGILRGPEPN